jgi:hypothetical protein
MAEDKVAQDELRVTRRGSTAALVAPSWPIHSRY